MSVDPDLVRRIARLARIKVADSELPHLAAELNSILSFVEELKEVDVEGVEPMTSVMPMSMKQRPDVVNDGEMAEAIAANAPAIEDHYFVVPKVIE
jgi:aspartyl-tRNA(Asn)/glutamyl-tRNA(Gln) amidotransferase subunit C